MARHPRALMVIVFALLTAFTLTASLFGAPDTGSGTTPATASPSTAAPVPDPQQPIIMRILLAKIQGDLNTSAPGGVYVTTLEGQELYKSPDAGLQMRRVENGILLVGVNPPAESTPASPDATASPSPAGMTLPAPVLVSPVNPASPLTVNGKLYRGQLKVISQDNFLWLINVVELEQYLYGVVPKEFRSKYPEVCKAQAVVARTYALGHIGKFEKLGYDFDCTPSFQVYGGFSCEDPVCTEAVNATRGLVLVYNGKLAKYPLYHSTCGGSTTSNEATYLTSPLGYLRGTECRDDLKDPKPDPSATVTPSPSPSETPVLAPSPKPPAASPNPGETPVMGVSNDGGAVEEEDFLRETDLKLCYRSSLYRWKVTWTYSEMLEIVKKYWNKKEIKEIKDIRVVKRDSSHRVQEICIETDAGPLTEQGDRIRGLLQMKNKDGGRSSLYSTRFMLSKTGNGIGASWMAAGSGWGHGLGMCQFGALGLATHGYTFQEILKKYFNGVEIVPGYNLIPSPMQGSGKKE